MHALLIKFIDNTCCLCRNIYIFSKLKLITSYPKSTMLQEKLNELVILLIIKNEMLEYFKYENLISNFLSPEVRIVIFK